jgi:hypothetical protein
MTDGANVVNCALNGEASRAPDWARSDGPNPYRYVVPKRHRRAGLNVAVSASFATVTAPKTRTPAPSVTSSAPATVRASIGSENRRTIGVEMSTMDCAVGSACTLRRPAVAPSGSPTSTVPVAGACPVVLPRAVPSAPRNRSVKG